jgi:hypothetical protein
MGEEGWLELVFVRRRGKEGDDLVGHDSSMIRKDPLTVLAKFGTVRGGAVHQRNEVDQGFTEMSSCPLHQGVSKVNVYSLHVNYSYCPAAPSTSMHNVLHTPIQKHPYISHASYYRAHENVYSNLPSLSALYRLRGHGLRQIGIMSLRPIWESVRFVSLMR